MANCKKKKCKCGTRICSPGVQILRNDCKDVCVNPICEEPKVLSLMAPLVYDEIGINLCTTFDICEDVLANYPTAVSATVNVVNMTYGYGNCDVSIEDIPGRPNCYSITLSNIDVTFAIKIYDVSCRLLATIFQTVLYLPSAESYPTYDKATNPDSVELEIFAPYGLAFNDVEGPIEPIINYVGFAAANNFVRQGVNMFGIPKLIDFDVSANTATVGLTIVLQSLYFAGYHVESAGRVNTPKGSLIPEEESDCMRFVEGDLLELAIKPLELGPPACEERYKKECKKPVETCGGCPQSSGFHRPSCGQIRQQSIDGNSDLSE